MHNTQWGKWEQWEESEKLEQSEESELEKLEASKDLCEPPVSEDLYLRQWEKKRCMKQKLAITS